MFGNRSTHLVCTQCGAHRKMGTRRDNTSLTCHECRGKMVNMGLAYKPPRKGSNKFRKTLDAIRRGERPVRGWFTKETTWKRRMDPIHATSELSLFEKRLLRRKK